MAKTPTPERPRVPGRELKRLDVFLGRWKTTGRIQAGPSSKAARLEAVDTYEWLPGGFFLLHRVAGRMGKEEVNAVEIIGASPSKKGYATWSFDDRGNVDEYRASLEARVWKIVGKSARFSGAFSKDGRTLAGKWARSRGGARWEPWMEVRLTKAKPRHGRRRGGSDAASRSRVRRPKQ